LFINKINSYQNISLSPTYVFKKATYGPALCGIKIIFLCHIWSRACDYKEVLLYLLNGKRATTGPVTGSLTVMSYLHHAPLNSLSVTSCPAHTHYH